MNYCLIQVTSPQLIQIRKGSLYVIDIEFCCNPLFFFFLQSVLVQSTNCVKMYTMTYWRVLNSVPL
jgi:hypothetical protein